jgi:hypothetical protein
MVCQLRPLGYSLGLNNPLSICLTPRKSRVKNLCRNKQGNWRCKMAGAGIWSLAKFRGQMPRIATTGITSWQTALKWTADAKFRTLVAAVKSSLWQSALKIILLSVAIRTTDILFLAIHVLNAADCHKETEFQLPPLYIESPPVWVFILGDRLLRDWAPIYDFMVYRFPAYLQLPNLSGHLCLSMGKSFRSIKQAALKQNWNYAEKIKKNSLLNTYIQLFRDQCQTLFR